MSKWYPCVYCTEDLHCTKYEEPGYESWCVLGPCTAETPSHGDLIRRMTDEELADEYIRIYKRLPNYSDSWAWLREWLKSPVDTESGS